MARLACLGTLTVLLLAASALSQTPPDANAPSSDDYVLVDATDLSDAVLSHEFKWPQGTIIDSQKSSSSCGGLSERVRGFAPKDFGLCVVDIKLRVPRSHLDEVNALIERSRIIIRFGPSTKF
jgi:hypothetical protein